MSKIVNKLILPNFFLAFFLVNLPPFYFIPFFRNSFFHSYSLARFLILLNFLLFLYFIIVKKSIRIKAKKFFLFLFILFFISQSISVINATNISQFLYFYKDWIFVYMFILQVLIIVNSYEKKIKLIKILLFSSFINILIMFTIYFEPKLLIELLNDLFHDKYLEVLSVNQDRNKYFIEFIDFAFIPFFLYFIVKKSNKVLNFFCYFAIISLFFLGSISNFRTHLLLVFFSLILSIPLILPKTKQTLIFNIIFIFFLFNFLGRSLNLLPRFTIERFSFSPEEFGSIMGRFNMWNYSVEMFKFFPITGVGLGNYYDYLPNKEKEVFSIFKNIEILNKVTLTNPHNIFFWQLAEVGILGFISISVFLVYFLFLDLKNLKFYSYLNKSILITFWALVIYSFINPPTGLKFQVLFFMLRFLI